MLEFWFPFSDIEQTQQLGTWCDGIPLLNVEQLDRVTFSLSGVGCFPHQFAPFETEWRFKHRRDRTPASIVCENTAIADPPCDCNHLYFGSPKAGGEPFRGKVPKSKFDLLIKSVDQTLFADHQYLWCPNTRSIVEYGNGIGFRFLVCPFSWDDFAPKRISETDLKKVAPEFQAIAALLSSPSAGMGGLRIRITASDPATMMMGGGKPAVQHTSKRDGE